MAEKQLKARDKIVQKMTKDGLVSENLRNGEKKPVKQADNEQAVKQPSQKPQGAQKPPEQNVTTDAYSEEYISEETEEEESKAEQLKQHSTARQSADYFRAHQKENEPEGGKTVDSQGGDPNANSEKHTKKSRLSFEDERGGMVRGIGMGVKKAAGKGTSAAVGYAHSKLHQAEKENSAVEAAHKSEETAEWLYHDFRRKPRGKRTRDKSARSEKKRDDKLKKERLQFSEDEGGRAKKTDAEPKAKDQNSGGKPSAAQPNIGASKESQKQRYKKAYAAAKHSSQTAEAGKEAATATNTVTSKVKSFVQDVVAEHKTLLLGIGVGLLLFFLMGASLSSCSVFIQGTGSTFVGTTYPSKDTDMKAAEEAYLKLEEELNKQINEMESTHPGYDEYRYVLDEIGHDPYQLISHLTAVYEEFTVGQVEEAIEELFKQQYILTVSEQIEIRTRTETRTSYDPFTGESYTYEVEVQYQYKILNIQLKNNGFDKVARANMDAKQTGRYEAYNLTYGNRPELFGAGSPTYSGRTTGSIGTGGSGTGSGTGGGSSGGYQYDVPEEALSDEKFAKMLAEAQKYLGMAYVWGGSSPETGFDCSGYVSWVINHCGNGWNVGRQTAEGLRQCTTYVSASEAKPGDLIFFEKTYNTTGASHVGIYLGDGMMIHCGDPISYSSIYSNYWQSHFLAFGRIS